MGAKAKVKKYEIIEWEGNTWIRRVGHQHPIAYLEGYGQLDKADQVAGLFGIKEAHENKQRWARAQKQLDIIRAIPGLRLWKERIGNGDDFSW